MDMKVKNRQNSDKVNIFRSSPVATSQILKHGRFYIKFSLIYITLYRRSEKVIQKSSTKMF